MVEVVEAEIKDEDDELSVRGTELFVLVEAVQRAADQFAPTTTGFFAAVAVVAVRKLLGPEGSGR
jgi:hypothetical protein